MSALEKFSLSIGTDVVCRILGVPPDAMLQKAGLAANQGTRTELRVTAKQYFAAWNAAVEISERSKYLTHLGVAMARGPIIPVFFALTCAPQLEIGAKRLQEYKSLLGPTVMRSFWSEGAFHVEFGSADAHIPLPGSLAALHLILFAEYVRQATAQPVRPIAAALDASPADREEVADVLGVKVTSGPVARLSFSPEDTRRPFISENSAVWSVFETDLDQQVSARNAGLTFTERVRATLHRLFAAGRANADDVCVELGLSRSSLQRRLRAEKTTFRDVLRQARQDASLRYLENTDLKVQDIGALLGYRDGNSFTRSFRQWTGMSPEAYRQSKSGARPDRPRPGETAIRP